MDVLRVVDAFCVSCDEVRQHAVPADDPGSCFCVVCGTCEVLVAPIGSASLGCASQDDSTPFHALAA